MKLFLNDVEFSYRLENEKTLEDIVASMREILSRENLYVLDYRYDLFTPGDTGSSESIPVEKIKNLYFEIGEKKDLLVSTLKTHLEYVDLIGNKVFFSEFPLRKAGLEELEQAIQWIQNALSVIAGMLGIDTAKWHYDRKQSEYNLEHILEEIVRFIRMLQDSDEEAFYRLKWSIIENLKIIRIFFHRMYLQTVANYFQDRELAEGIQNIERKIENWISEMVKINEYFQTGKDEKSLELIGNLMENIEMDLFFLNLAIERAERLSFDESIKKIKEVMEETYRILEQIAGALEKFDVVTIGDSFEYELAEKMREIGNMIPSLIKILTMNVGM